MGIIGETTNKQTLTVSDSVSGRNDTMSRGGKAGSSSTSTTSTPLTLTSNFGWYTTPINPQTALKWPERDTGITPLALQTRPRPSTLPTVQASVGLKLPATPSATGAYNAQLRLIEGWVLIGINAKSKAERSSGPHLILLRGLK